MYSFKQSNVSIFIKIRSKSVAYLHPHSKHQSVIKLFTGVAIEAFSFILDSEPVELVIVFRTLLRRNATLINNYMMLD